MKKADKSTKKPNKKARTYRRRAIKIVALILAVLITTWFLQEFILCNANHNTERIRGFYLEDEDSLDVVVVGSSEVYCDYSAGLAYEECGYTSYPFATEANTARNYEAIIREIKRTQDPKLIVIEINGAIYGDVNLSKEVNLRRVTDNIPLNENKIDLVEKGATSDQIEYYVPFIKYHDSWDNFGNSIGWSISMILDRLRGYNLLKGVKNRSLILKPTKKVYPSARIQTRRPLFGKSYDALIEFLQMLIDEGITSDQILFVRFPHVVTEDNLTRYNRGNTIGDIVRRYGYKFVSFEADDPEIGLDVNHDFYNIEHMNIYGQQKFTKYFSHWLQENYDIAPSELTDKQQEEWDLATKYYDAYIEYSEQVISEGKDMEIGESYFCMREIKKLLS